MGRVGRGKEVLSTAVNLSVKTYLEGRASRLDQSMSWVISGAVDFWIACGAPPLSPADQHTPMSQDLVRQLMELMKEPQRAALVATITGDNALESTLAEMLRMAEQKAKQEYPLPPRRRKTAPR